MHTHVHAHTPINESRCWGGRGGRGESFRTRQEVVRGSKGQPPILPREQDDIQDYHQRITSRVGECGKPTGVCGKMPFDFYARLTMWREPINVHGGLPSKAQKCSRFAQ